MGQSHSTLPLALAILVGFCVVVPPARGRSIGFREFLKHHQSDPIALPPLYSPAPMHVPHITDKALIRLWEPNDYVPILKNAMLEMQLAQAVIDQRNLNPTRFDHFHPGLGLLIRDPNFFKYVLHLYGTHTARFVHYHHRLIPFIRGYAMLLMMPKSPQVGNEMLEIPPPPSGVSSSIPAPPSIVLLVLGLSGVCARIHLGPLPGRP
jgi:hypothetical protein